MLRWKAATFQQIASYRIFFPLGYLLKNTRFQDIQHWDQISSSSQAQAQAQAQASYPGGARFEESSRDGGTTGHICLGTGAIPTVAAERSTAVVQAISTATALYAELWPVSLLLCLRKRCGLAGECSGRCVSSCLLSGEPAEECA